MARRSGKSVSFDTMVKLFIRKYNIPTKKDIEKIQVRLERMERSIQKVLQLQAQEKLGGSAPGRRAPGANPSTASDVVLGCVASSRQGVRFSDIQEKTGFAEKKLRNIIFRLHKLGKIKRKARGVYVAS